MNIKVIGVGGIGSHLLLPLVQYLNFPSNTKYKLDELLLIDGDKFEHKNNSRQFVPKVSDYKAQSTSEYYKDKFPELEIYHSNTYITEENIREFVRDGDIIFLCVDNNTTRKLVNDYLVENIENVILISGGNEYTDGNAQIFQKYRNINLSPSLTETHPEINEAVDKNPDDMSCEELAEAGSAQLSIVNAGVADAMRRMLMGVLSDGIKYNETYINFINGNIRNITQDQSLKFIDDE